MRVLGSLAVFLALVGFAVVGAEVYIVVQVEPSGSGIVTGAGYYPQGATVTLEGEPAAGFRFLAWEEEGRELGTSPLLTFTAEFDRVLVARFELVPAPPSFSGRWDGDLSLLPTLGLTTSRLELTMNHVLLDTVSAIASFSPAGWTDLSFRGSSRLWGVSLSWGLSFDPVSAGYKSSYLALLGSWNKLRWNLRASHSPLGGVPPGPYLLYTVGLNLSPFSLTAHWEDGAEGVEFRDLLGRVNSIALLEECLGIRAQGALSLTREEGFSYFDIQVSELSELCCGLNLAGRVKFTPAAKEVSIIPRWNPISGCLTAYSDIEWDEGTSTLKGLALYGFKISCCLDCGACPGVPGSGPYLELVSALNPAKVPGGFRGDEFEYWKLGFCGLACCGGYWYLEVSPYFSHSGGLLGLSRIRLRGGFPLTPDLKLEGTWEMDVLGGDLDLSLGWDWRF